VNRRFQTKRTKYSNFCIIKNKECDCNQIFHRDKDDQILVEDYRKICRQKSKMADGRDIEKNRYIAIFQQRIDQFERNFEYGRILAL